ncbi:MAG: hypothetical protein IT379_04930 [Deltaproteobacteria bacterium]|nr:hypothetical protein [Deltaproteobacteria bacterium]
MLPFVAALAGCPPDLGYFRIVEAPPPPPDSGVPPVGPPAPPGQPLPPPLGTPCTLPHVLVAAANSDYDSVGRVYRLNLPDLSPCRETEVAQEHPAFGNELLSVASVPGGAELVGTSGAVLGLDADGFPLWRFQPEANLGYYPSRIVEVATESGWNLLVLGTYMGEADLLHLVSPTGFQRTMIDVSWSDDVGHIAAHPDGFGFLGAGDYGAVEAHTLSDGTTMLDRGTEVLQIPRAADGEESFGSLLSLDVDREGRRVVYTWSRFVAQVPYDDPAAPITAFACGAPCSSFVDATYDPTDPTSLIALCNHTEGNAVHLVRVPSDGASPCYPYLDGMLIRPFRPVDLAIIR